MSNNIVVMGLFLAAVIIFAVVYQYFERKTQKRLLEYQAEKRNGYVETSSYLLPVRLMLPIDEHTLSIYTEAGGKNRPSKTIAELTGIAWLPYVKIQKNGLFQKALGAFGRERFRIGDEEFDRYFVVRADDENAARRVLSMEVQRNLLAMANNSPSIEIEPGFFRLVIQRMLRDDEGYDLFIDTALAILNKLREKEFHA